MWDVHAALPDVPVVGVGGMRTGFDALAMLLAGATAVQLGSVLLRDPSAATRIADELADELAARDLGRPADAVGLGTTHPKGTADDVRQPAHAARSRTGAASASASTRTRRCSTPGG